ncbi:MAG: WXG100 family type VII secretion target [Thermoguttaceae bacterium]
MAGGQWPEETTSRDFLAATAMPQAIVDPEELRRFAQSLKKFNTDMQERTTSLSGQLASLEQSWRDQEQKKFADEFQQQIQVLGRLIETIDRHIPYLLRKAEIIEEYLQQR